MKFVLEVTITEPDQEKVVSELGRVLRYWAGNLKHYDLSAPANEHIYDSAYNAIGTWAAEPGS